MTDSGRLENLPEPDEEEVEIPPKESGEGDEWDDDWDDEGDDWDDEDWGEDEDGDEELEEGEEEKAKDK